MLACQAMTVKLWNACRFLAHHGWIPVDVEVGERWEEMRVRERTGEREGKTDQPWDTASTWFMQVCVHRTAVACSTIAHINTDFYSQSADFYTILRDALRKHTPRTYTITCVYMIYTQPAHLQLTAICLSVCLGVGSRREVSRGLYQGYNLTRLWPTEI